eukprot:scaffold369876_cov96-Cyclotella_meneghiniana.AAC.1
MIEEVDKEMAILVTLDWSDTICFNAILLHTVTQQSACVLLVVELNTLELRVQWMFTKFCP